MDASITSWCSCNEEAQWLYDCNNDEINMNNNNNGNNNAHSNKNHNNNYDSKNINTYSNSINNNNNNNPNVTQVTFNQCKTNEMRQTHLQRQRELQQQQHQHQHQQTPTSHEILNAAPTTLQQQSVALQSVISEKSHTTHYISSPLPHRVTRRKQRLQRQKPTELDDVDFAYAADLEEEDEEDDDVVGTSPPQQPQQSPIAAPLLGLSRSEQVATTPPTFANKRLQHLQQQMHSSTPFDGRPLSLPNTSYVTTTSMMSIHQQHLQNQQHHHHHHHQPQYHLPPHRERRLRHEESFDSSTTNTTNTTDTATSPASPALRRHNFSLLKRGNSTHSESSSHYSSLDSLLEARKPDPEAILINLGFGPVGSQDILSRIPKRFLKPSQVRGIDTEAFVRRIQLASNLADHSVMGYRGLTGNPDIPPSRIVAKIMHRFEVNERKKSMGSIEQTI